MQKSHELISSDSMGRSMHLWRYGHFGMPLLVFPSAAGMAHEWEAHGMVDDLADMIYGGRVKLYCTESNVAEAWTRKEAPAEWRIARHRAYEHYVSNELVSFIRNDCNSEEIKIATTGCSLGAYYAVNFALKFPETFHIAIGMSGRYDMSRFNDGAGGEELYFNNPLAYVANLNGESLERVKRGTRITLVCGQGRFEEGNIEETRALGDLLTSKGISNECDLWGHDVAHEWSWWKRQIKFHLDRVAPRRA